MNLKYIALIWGVSIYLSSCKDVDDDKVVGNINDNELIALNKISRLNWFKSTNAIQAAVHRKSLDKSTVDRIFYRALSYDIALSYENEEFDSSMAVKHLKLMKSRGLLGDDFTSDPFSLLEYFEKNPDKYPMGLNLGEKVVADKKAYKKFVAWFNVQLNPPK